MKWNSVLYDCKHNFVAEYGKGLLEFMVCDALDLPFENKFDVVFSNAVFHWIKDQDLLLQNIYKALKPKGVLVCEFGANGNIAMIENAFSDICRETEYAYTPKFNFPTTEDFGRLLEKSGFFVDAICDYDRPTPLKDAEKGLENWMKQFFSAELEVMTKNMQVAVIKKVEELTRESLWNGNEWVADYRRIRVVAHI